jgi:hypothetical protein
MSEISGHRSIRYSLSVFVTAKRSSDFLLYKRSKQPLNRVSCRGRGVPSTQPNSYLKRDLNLQTVQGMATALLHTTGRC